MTSTESTEVSTTDGEICLLCIQQEATRLISICLELGLELKTREDVMNLIRISSQSYLCKDSEFIERVIDAFLEQM
ncbi:MAG: hypothetical protein ACFFCP_08085 [Promethearchaeota archaeon]